MVSSIVVYGGSGALGRAIVSTFIKKQWSVISVDFSANPEATTNVLLERGDSLEEQGKRVLGGVVGQVDAIVCVAGGWAGGNAASSAQKGTPFMIGYGMAKAAVHQLVASLAGPDSGLPATAKVNAILPTIHGWATKAVPFTSGKLVEIVTKDSKTTYTEK
ncbi:hypothetical protein BG005_006988 [Podila minutissima]|nr:hypothetical protein BG005_006988 [Podila minutissima]